jgi:hypothetical protein
MKNLTLLILACLWQSTAFADGGAVQLRSEAGGLAITVFTTPAPLTAGPIDVSLLLQDRDSLKPVLDADVSLLLRSRSTNCEIRATASHGQATNKLLYAAPLMLTESGAWQIAVSVLRNGKRAEIGGTIEVLPAPQMAASYWGYVAFPPLAIVGFAVREFLLRRRLKPKVRSCGIT